MPSWPRTLCQAAGAAISEHSPHLSESVKQSGAGRMCAVIPSICPAIAFRVKTHRYWTYLYVLYNALYTFCFC